MNVKSLIFKVCLAVVLTLGLASCDWFKPTEKTALALCKDPHNTGGGGGIQACVRQSDCGVCGTGWQCWNASGGDTNCHTHAPGTPWSGPP